MFAFGRKWSNRVINIERTEIKKNWMKVSPEYITFLLNCLTYQIKSIPKSGPKRQRETHWQVIHDPTNIFFLSRIRLVLKLCISATVDLVLIVFKEGNITIVKTNMFFKEQILNRDGIDSTDFKVAYTRRRVVHPCNSQNHPQKDVEEGDKVSNPKKPPSYPHIYLSTKQ